MFFRRLRAEGSWSFEHEIHPRVTVLTGLGADRQIELAAMVEDTLYGRAARLLGTVDLNNEEIDLADWAQQVGDALDRVELVIRSTDLPAQAAEDLGELALAERAAAEARRRLDVATEAVVRARTTLARATARQAAATSGDGPGGAGSDAASAGGAGAGLELADAERKLAEAEAVLTSAMRALAGWGGEPAAPYDQDADQRIEADAQRLQAAVDDARRELGELEARHHSAMEALDATRKPNGPPEPAGPDPGFIAKMREAVSDAQEAVTLPRRDSIQRLLADHTRLVDRRAQLGPAPSQWMIDLAKTSLDEAQHEFAEAEAALPSSAHLTNDDIAEIEQLHREATEAAERADRRFVSPVAKRRLAAAMAAEREALSRLGFATYGAYLLRGVGQGDTGASERFERARKALADAEAVWEELQAREGGGDQDGRRSDERRFLAEAAALLERQEVESWALTDAAAALESLARDDRRVLDERMLALRGLLADADIDVGDRDPIAEASTWLEAQAQRDERVATVAEHERVVAALERDWDSQVDRVDALERDLARLEAARGGLDREQLEAAVADAERRVAACAEAVEAARATGSDSGTVADEQVARTTLDEAEANMTAEAARYAEANDRLIAIRAVRTTVTRAAEPNRVVDAEIYVLARLAAVRSVATFGSMPLVLVEPFGDLPAGDVRRVLDTIGRMSEVIQVLVITDRADIVSWAEALDAEKAAVCRFEAPGDSPAA